MKGVKCTHNAGVTSCLSMRLYDVVKFYQEHNEFPDYIDSSDIFQWYKDEENQDVSQYILGNYEKKIVPYVPFYHGHPNDDKDWQYKWYNDIDLDNLNIMAKWVTPLSNNIMDKVSIMSNKMGERTAILCRSNDKHNEVRGASYNTIVEIAKRTDSNSFLLQTDDEDFYQYFVKIFPDTLSFDEIPRIYHSKKHFVMPPIGNRVDFACNFLSALYTISKSKKLILTTGNTGLWTMIFRGTSNNVWQYNGKYNEYRKL